jgi:hypothetical protein
VLFGDGVCSLADCGAVGDNVTDDLPAFQDAVARVAAQPDAGGVIYVPPGSYRLSDTWDLSSLNQVAVVGCGSAISYLLSDVRDGAAIRLCSGTNKPARISGLALWQRERVYPDLARPGNCGIEIPPAGSGFGAIIDGLEIRYFGDTGIAIHGPTGPTVVRDTYIYWISGYGIALRTVGPASPQDVLVQAGAIQECWGGIEIAAGISTHVMDTDIELGHHGRFPCVHLSGGSAGCSLTNVTASIGAALIDPPGVLTFGAGSIGNTVVGGSTAALHPDVDNVILCGGGTNHTTFIGGTFIGAGAAASGFPFTIEGAENTTIIQPQLVNYAPGKARVHDTLGNHTSTFGIRSAHGEPDESSVGLPATTIETLAVNGVAGFNGRIPCYPIVPVGASLAAVIVALQTLGLVRESSWSDDMSQILTGLEQIEQALTRTLEREGCSSDQGCSALANVLLTALVRCKRDPRISAHVAEEMRRLAVKLNELAGTDEGGLDAGLRDAKLH